MILRFVIPLFLCFQVIAFDWVKYLERNPDLKNKRLDTWQAFGHYLKTGIAEGRMSVDPIDDSEFDWVYYKRVNKLSSIRTESEALHHYHTEGFFENLSYCPTYKFAILLHVYYLNLLPQLISDINKCLVLNEKHDFIIKVNIPVDKNIENIPEYSSKKQIARQKIFEKVKSLAPYHPSLVTEKNYLKLYNLYKIIKSNFYLDGKKIEVIFSENRGLDIGGFFLLLDRLLKQNIQHDFILKIHSKLNQKWSDLLTSFTRLRLGKIVTNYDVIYSMNMNYDFQKRVDADKQNVRGLLNKFGLPEQSFSFCGGTMFLVSNKFSDFFRKFNLIELYNELNLFTKRTKPVDGLIEHAYERFFGYLFNYLGLKTRVIDYVKKQYQLDQKAQLKIKTKPTKSEIASTRKLIQDHNITLMAIYFPQFHVFDENNKFWGYGFTEWTLINKFDGEIKKPHVEVGQYNMLDYHVRKKQRFMAQKYGIDAFLYYHYWFKDKPVMQAGLEIMLQDGEPDMPFAFCWANETWTKRWDGLNNEVLLAQEYGTRKDWIKHYEYLLKFFKHKNYIKINNAPLFFVYRMDDIDKNNSMEMFTLWKKLIVQEGFDDLIIVSILGSRDPIYKNPIINGYAEHNPNFNGFRATQVKKENGYQECNSVNNYYKSIPRNKKIGDFYIRGINYSFDQSSRRVNLPALKLVNLDYTNFSTLIANTVAKTCKDKNKFGNYILLNSWNEWSEQAMIEPNEIDGHAMLKVIGQYFK